MLKALWPPLTEGFATIARPLHPLLSNFGTKSPRTVLQIPADFSNTSDKSLHDKLQILINAERDQRKCAPTKGKVQNVFKGSILQSMDLGFYGKAKQFGNIGKAKSLLNADYIQACVQVGIEP